MERGQGLGQHRLAHTGHVLDQEALGQQGDEREADHVRLGLDVRLDVVPDLVEGGGDVVHAARIGRVVATRAGLSWGT